MTNRFMVRIGSLVLVGNYSGNGITIKIQFGANLKTHHKSFDEIVSYQC